MTWMKLKCEASLLPEMAEARQHIFCFLRCFLNPDSFFVAVPAVLSARAKTNPSDGSMRKTIRLFRAVSALVALRAKHTLLSTAGRLHRGTPLPYRDSFRSACASSPLWKVVPRWKAMRRRIALLKHFVRNLQETPGFASCLARSRLPTFWIRLGR